MNIVGLQKVSLLNYPGLVSATIYVNGCNFKCPFCHNSSIVKCEYETLSEDEIFKYTTEEEFAKLIEKLKEDYKIISYSEEFYYSDLYDLDD